MKQGKAILILLLGILLILSTSDLGSNEIKEQRISPVQDVLITAYEEHSPIRIRNNTDFFNQAQTEGWEGDGTSDTPYMITGYNITENNNHCIYISDVTVYFTIANCLLKGSIHTSGWSGIFIQDSWFGSVENCTITMKENGIHLDNDWNIRIHNCSISDCDENQIYSSNSMLCSFGGSHIYNGQNSGIKIVGGMTNSISSCSFENISETTIEFFVSSGGGVYDSTIEGNNRTKTAVYIESSDNIRLINVSVTGCNESVFSGIQSPFTSISDCTIYSNIGGIELIDCDVVTIVRNEIYNNTGGIQVLGVNYLGSRYYIEGNTIDGSSGWISVSQSYTATITNNTINGGGIHVDDIGSSNIDDNRVSNNSQSGIVLLKNFFANYNSSLSNNVVSHNDGFGFRYAESGRITMVGNIVYANNNTGVYCHSLHSLTMRNNQIMDNAVAGVRIEYSINSLVENNNLTNNQIGLTVIQTDEISITENNVSCSAVGPGITIDESHFSMISDNIVSTNAIHGIHLTNSNNCTIMNNKIYHNEGDGIHSGHSNSTHVIDNSIFSNSEDGIDIWFSHNWEITGNTIWDHTSSGIVLFRANDCTISENIVYDLEIGVYLNESANCLVYLNDIGWWGGYGGMEYNSTSTNCWDDNVSIGNYWVGHTGSQPYAIYNLTDNISNYDRYPMASFWAENYGPYPSYELGTTGHTLTLDVFARNPSHYELYLDNELLLNESWDGNAIIIDIDGLSIAEYNYTLIVYHISGYSATTIAYVTVQDTLGPEWVDIPENQIIEYLEQFSYQLNVTDPSGISSWFLNDTLHFSIVDGLITNTTVLEVGRYWINITVIDSLGNSRSSIVLISVLPENTTATTLTTVLTTTSSPTTITTATSAPTTSTTTDGNYTDSMSVVLLVGGAVGAVAVIVILTKFRQK